MTDHDPEIQAELDRQERGFLGERKAQFLAEIEKIEERIKELFERSPEPPKDAKGTSKKGKSADVDTG